MSVCENCGRDELSKFSEGMYMPDPFGEFSDSQWEEEEHVIVACDHCGWIKEEYFAVYMNYEWQDKHGFTCHDQEYVGRRPIDYKERDDWVG